MIFLLTSSDGGLNWYFWGFVAFLFVVFYVLSARRTKNLTKAAAGFGFVPNETMPIDQTALVFRGTTSFDNQFVGNWNGYEAAFFDLRVGSGRASYEQTVAGFKRNANLRMPPFRVHIKDFSDKIAMKFSHAYLDIEGDPGFTERYSVKTVEAVKAECQQFFDDAALRAFLSQLPPHNFLIEGADDTVLVYRYGKKVAPEKIGEFLTETGNIAIELLSQLKEKPPLLGEEDEESDAAGAGK